MQLVSPTVLRLSNERLNEIRRFLTYKNTSAFYQLQKFKKNRWFADKYGQEAFQTRIDEMKAAVEVCLLLEDDSGYYTHSGLAADLSHTFRLQFENLINYPSYKLVPYAKAPEFEPRYYQKEAVDALLEAKHAAISLATGGGKSMIIEMLAKQIGLQTLIMAPSVSIAGQLYRQFCNRFGQKYVGMYGDGKKHINKLFTIGIGASLTKVEPRSPAWKHFSKCQVFIGDESHLLPATTLESVCHGLMANAPFRFFVSGTQMRGDGADLLLKGITGPIVYSKDLKELVDEGFLAKPNFFLHRISSDSSFQGDYDKMMQIHFWGNANMHRYAAVLANRSVETLGHQVVILVEHVDQLQYLLPHLKYDVGFAHGGLNKDNKGSVDPRFHKSDPTELVDKFNAGQLKVLVGTSCIGTGTDILPVKTVINLQGGVSEVKIKQAIGRGTRKVPGKTEFNYHDFAPRLLGTTSDTDFYNLSSVEKHSYTRAQIYDSVYGPTKWIG